MKQAFTATVIRACGGGVTFQLLGLSLNPLAAWQAAAKPRCRTFSQEASAYQSSANANVLVALFQLHSPFIRLRNDRFAARCKEISEIMAGA